MEISFFEEFPKPVNLEKIKLVDFPTKLYIAAHSLQEFREFEKKVGANGCSPLLVYWVVLKKWEGYWISPFSARSALIRCLNEVREEHIEIMLDLENPVHAPWLYILELPNFWRNKRFISQFIEHGRPKITLVELSGNEEKLKFWGLAYESETAYVAKMAYTSLMVGGREKKIARLREICKKGVEQYGGRFKIGLGCIARGISGIEPILSPDKLAEDLKIAKESKVEEAIIFRLGGLTPDYIRAIKTI